MSDVSLLIIIHLDGTLLDSSGSQSILSDGVFIGSTPDPLVVEGGSDESLLVDAMVGSIL